MNVLTSERLNSWPLLYVMIAINSAAVVVYLPFQELYSPLGVMEMIRFSVKCCVPFLYLAFVASSLNVLFPGTFSQWLLRNRRYFGLAFAAGMGWQLVFILWLVIGHWTYYIEEVYVLAILVPEVIGYIILTALTISSFHPVRNKMNYIAWRVLHWTGIYYLWYAMAYTYTSAILSTENLPIIYYIHSAGGLLTYFMRVVAWIKLRTIQLLKFKTSHS